MSIATKESASSLGQLVGKTVVVVGGSYGNIGYAVAQSALEHGARIILTSLNPSRVDEAVERLLATNESFEGSVSGIPFDAGDTMGLEAFWDRVGQFDHLVWTAGNPILTNFFEDDLSAQQDFANVRFWGTVSSVKYVHKKGLIKAGGSISLSTGISKDRPRKGLGMLASMGGAGQGLMRALAVDMAPVRVNVINGGTVDTRLWDAIGLTGDARAAHLKVAAERTLVKHVAQPSEIAEAYIFAMKCTFFTGQTLNVEGGALLA